MNDKTDDEEPIDEIDCIEAIGHLYAFLDGEILDPNSKTAFEQHLSHCRSCYSRSQFEKELNKRIKDSAQSETPDSLKDRLKNIIDKF